MMLLLCTSFSTATHQTKDKNQYRLFPWMLLQGRARLLGFRHHWSYSCWSPSTSTRASQDEELFQTAREYQPPVSVYGFSSCYCCSMQSAWADVCGGLREAPLCTDLLLCSQEPLNWLLCPRFADTFARAWECAFSWASFFGSSAWAPHCWLEDLPSQLQRFPMGRWITSADVMSGKDWAMTLFMPCWWAFKAGSWNPD